MAGRQATPAKAGESASRGAAAAQDVQRARFAAQMLSGEPSGEPPGDPAGERAGRRAGSPVAVAERLLAVQGQDPRGFRLAVRARTAGLTAADVDRALTTDRSLLVTWLNRGTLHLIRSADYWMLHRLMVRPQFETSCRRMLARLGVGDAGVEAGVAVVEKALTADGPLTRDQLRQRLVAAGLPAAGNASLHVLAIVNARGIAVRGPMIGAQHAYVQVRDWLGAPPPEPEPDVALGWLARRYLAGHGPAADRDLAKWAGLPLGQVRRGLTVIAADLRDRQDGLAELAAADQDYPPLPPPRLLGAFDPALLGWADRDPILGRHHQIVTVNGLFRSFALVGGRAGGTWTWTGGQVALEPFGEFPASVSAALAAEALDVQRFLAAEPDLAGD